MNIKSIFTERQKGSTSILISNIVLNMADSKVIFVCRDETAASWIKKQYLNTLNILRKVYLTTYTQFLRIYVNRTESDRSPKLLTSSADTVLIFDDWMNTELLKREKIAKYLISFEDDSRLREIIIGGSYDDLNSFEEFKNNDILFNYLKTKPEWCKTMSIETMRSMLSLVYDVSRQKELEDFLKLVK